MANTFLQSKSKTTNRNKFSIFRMLSIFCLVMGFGVSGVMGQNTIPTAFSLSGGDFSLTTYTGTSFPTNMAIGFESNGTDGTFNTDLASDVPTNGTSAGNWNDEGANGISYQGGSSSQRGSFLFRCVSTGRTTIQVGWVVRDISVQANTNYIELQWRSGASGTWNDVTGDIYQQGTTTNGTSFSVTLPSGAENLSDLRIRWIYYENGSNSRDRLAIDEISVTSVSGSTPTINIGTLNEFTTSATSTPSAEQTLVVSGTSLTNVISLAPPTGFEISTVSGGGFTPTNPITITAANANAGNTNIYVRYNPATLAVQPQVAGTNITATSTGAVTQNVTVLGSVRNLSQGDFAVIGFNCSTTDAISFVALTTIPANTIIKFTDNGYSDATTQMLTEGYLIYTAPSTISAGTVVSWNNGMTISGTGWNSNAPTNFALNASGEQLFAYQGTWGVSGGTTTLHQGFMTGGTWTTIGAVPSVTSNSYLPTGLTTGTSAADFANANTYYTNNATNTVNTKATIYTRSSTAVNWSTSASQITPVPSWTFNIIADEPTTQPSFSAATSVGNNQMTLNFTGGNGTSYMVVMREGSAVTATPVDATNYSTVSGSVNFSTATELSAGQRIVYNGTTATGTVTVTNLAAGTTYHYAIYAYNGTTTTANFFLTTPGTGNQLTTGSANSNTSDIIIHGSFTEPSNIAYAANQENTNLTDANSIEVARFTLRDGGGSGDADANPTTLNAITFAITNHSVLRRLALYNGTTELSEVAVTTGTATFSGLTLSAADDASQDFSLRASFAGTVTDNTQFSFTVSSATADPAGSNFAAADAGAAVSSTTGDRNRIEVTATLLTFVQQPSNVSINTAMTPAPTVSANDALGNRDLDYTTDMTASTTGTFGTSTNPVTPVAGLGTFSNLQFSAAATGRTIEVTSGSLTTTGNSNTFDVTSLIQPGDIAIISYQTDAPDGFSIITFVEIPASQIFYFTDKAWTSASGPLGASEETMTWTTPATPIPAGTVINFSNPTGSTIDVTPSGNGTASSALSGLSTSGDQILMFRGTNSTTPTAFICGASTTSWIATGSTTSNTSYLPADLTQNVSAVAFSSHQDNGYYNGTQSGSIASIKALVNNGANWLRSTSIQTPPTWAFTINATTTTISANASVQNLTLAASEKFNIGANTLTVNGTISGAGTLSGGSSSNLTITGTSGTVNFDQTTPGTTNVLRNLTISGTGTTTLGNALNINGGATAGVVTVGTGATLNTGGNLTLKSNATGTASIGNSSGTITGNITVERFIPGGRRAFRLISHPFSAGIKLNQLMDDIHITGATGATAGFDPTTTDNPSAFSFTESGFTGTTNSGWSAFTNASAGGNDIPANAPIRVLYRGPRSQSNLLDGSNPIPNEGLLTWSGSVNQGPVNVAMAYTGANGSNAGWNLLPNPYPSNYNVGATGSSDRNLIGNFSVWVPTNATRGAYVSQSFGSDYIIPSGAAFFVQTGSAANFVFSESLKSAAAPTATLLKNNSFKENALQIDVISDSIFWDKLEIRNREFGTANRDQEDGPKMVNPDVNFFSYTPSNEKLAIDNRRIESGNVIPLGFEVSAEYHFSFKVSNLTLNGLSVALVDNFLNKTTTLTENMEYKFTTTSDAKSKGLNRFELVFNIATGVKEAIETNFSLYPNPAQEQINLSLTSMNKGDYSFEIYNQLGALVKSGSLDFNNIRNQAINVEEMGNGVYFIKVFNLNATQTIKFIK